MRYVCDAPGGKTWFRIETEAEATTESDGMRHAVEKFFRKEQEKATQSFQPASTVYFEQEIGLKAHVQREMPLFLTLRDDEGNPLATAMLPPGGRDDRSSLTATTLDGWLPGPARGVAEPEGWMPVGLWWCLGS
jgi:hypothetical protein